MGILRGGLVTIVTILLFGSLVFTGVSLTIYFSLDYGALKPEMRNVVHDILIKEANLNGTIDNNLRYMKIFCDNHDVYTQEMENYSLEIPCDVVNQGSDAIINYTIDDLIEKNYYKEYNCSFIDCFSHEETPFFVFSKQSHDYWNSKFYLGLIISIILGALLFFFMDGRNNYPFFLGTLLVVLSFLFLGAGKIVSMIAGGKLGGYADAFALFFTQAYLVFLIFIILGVILIFLGIVLKFISFGRFIAKLFKREGKVNKEQIKKEVKEAVIEEKKPKKSKKPRKK